jgi:hypothetical protein
MSLWDEYQKGRIDDVLVEDLTSSMFPVLSRWLNSVAVKRLSDPYQVAAEIKNMFRVETPIPLTRPNNSIQAEPAYRFTQFILNISYGDSRLFFTILDYLVQNVINNDMYAKQLGDILDKAGHKYTVQEINGKFVVTERLPEDQKYLMDAVLNGSNVYSSEFYDGFVKLYGTNPDYTQAGLEIFQALESALKFYLGEDKGDNLGKILNWLETHPNEWIYKHPSDDQDDAEIQFTSQINFVNKAFRKTKHGQPDKKLTITKEHAEVLIRSVSLIIFELENTIELVR